MAQRIVVVGAGIAGLASAVALQRCGYEVTVIEGRTGTSTGAGISIWPNALAALDYIGAGDAVREAGGRITTGALRRRDGSWLRRPAPERLVKALGGPLVMVKRSVLRDILTGVLGPGSVEYGLQAVGMADSADGVRIELSDGTVRTARAVVGADGTRSMVARHLNGPLTDRYVGCRARRRALRDGPGLGRGNARARRRNRPRPDGAGWHVLVRGRACGRGPARAGRRVGLPAGEVRRLA